MWHTCQAIPFLYTEKSYQIVAGAQFSQPLTVQRNY
jgi:hypothetical protein